ncbi:HAMP domain-containing histidine kinase [Clostridium sp. YIM B02505]|uniref:histidine kinase n=1 Tax=Clostridium yunnanense TaxID=2800325 RepID=A0ABS1EPA1_9CLOT|nr:HAMP domain-containing sensor histidine kinase [Clostridium yunnanense]MBK1811187.1 HAMP domain-containing histidine kinase [Clostridium yunnanense]
MKYSIQYKIFIYFSIIIFIALSSLLFVSYKLTEKNNGNIINSDMIGAKRNLDIYLKQYFLINNMELTKKNFLLEAEEISSQLTAQIGNKVEVFDMEGKNISNNNPSITKYDSKDITEAIEGKINYSAETANGRTIVNLSYPITVENEAVEIIRYSKDYTELFNYSKNFKNISNIFAVLIFFVILIFSLLFSKQITRPIKKLAEASEDVAKGNFEIDLKVQTKDEIGYLAERFNIMVGKIKEQIAIIKKDKDALEKLQSENKTFFDNVTHELKTPITTIMGYAQAIEDMNLSEDQFYKKGLNCIIGESIRLNHMVIDLLELAKTSSNQFSYNFHEVDVGKVLINTCEEMSIKGKKYNINIVTSIGRDLHIYGDKERIKEVFVNLLDNSMKYGNVNSNIYVNAYKEEHEIFIKIKDLGEGISEEDLSKIFEPFYRVNKKSARQQGSAGLGLTIVKEIVEKHGGGITVNSKLKEGTEITIKFRGELNAKD